MTYGVVSHYTKSGAYDKVLDKKINTKTSTQYGVVLLN